VALPEKAHPFRGTDWGWLRKSEGYKFCGSILLKRKGSKAGTGGLKGAIGEKIGQVEKKKKKKKKSGSQIIYTRSRDTSRDRKVKVFDGLNKGKGEVLGGGGQRLWGTLLVVGLIRKPERAPPGMKSKKNNIKKVRKESKKEGT